MLREERQQLDQRRGELATHAELIRVREAMADLDDPDRALLRKAVYAAWLKVTSADRPLKGTVSDVAGEMGMSESALNRRRAVHGLTGEWPPSPPSDTAGEPLPSR